VNQQSLFPPPPAAPLYPPPPAAPQYPPPPPAPRKYGFWKWAGGVFAALVVIGAVAGSGDDTSGASGSGGTTFSDSNYTDHGWTASDKAMLRVATLDSGVPSYAVDCVVDYITSNYDEADVNDVTGDTDIMSEAAVRAVGSCL
jgi:hypothetical protein